MEHVRVGRDRGRDLRAVRAPHDDFRAAERRDLRELAELGAVLGRQRPRQEVAVREGDARVAPDEQAAVGDGAEGLARLVPARAVDLRVQLVALGGAAEVEPELVVPVDEEQLPLVRLPRRRLVQLDGGDVGRVLDRGLARLAGHDVAEPHGPAVRRVDDGHEVRAQAQHRRREPVRPEAGEARGRDLAAVVRVDRDGRGRQHQEELLRQLDEAHGLRRVEDVGRVEVRDVVDVDLRRRRHDEVAVAQRHLDDAVAVEVERLVDLGEHVSDVDRALPRQRRLVVLPLVLPLDDVREDERAGAARADELRAVGGPADVHDRARPRAFARAAPARAVAELEQVVGAHGEVEAVRRPAHGRDDVDVRLRLVELAPERVPDLVATVLAARDEQPVRRVPVERQRDLVVRDPARRLARLRVADRRDVDPAVADVRQRVAAGAVGHRVDRVRGLDERRPEVARLRPALDFAVLARRVKRGALGVPEHAQAGAVVRRHPLFLAARPRHEPEAPVARRDGEDVGDAAPHARHPRDGRDVGVELAALARHLGLLVPLEDRLVVAAAVEDVRRRPRRAGRHRRVRLFRHQFEPHHGARQAAFNLRCPMYLNRYLWYGQGVSSFAGPMCRVKKSVP